MTHLHPTLDGFEHIKRYWDRSQESYTAKILPGEYYVTKHNELITTVLGSCISACIRDPKAKVGGMNHFMLPVKNSDASWAKDSISDATRYGNWAMEHLINDILKAGGFKKNLEIKIFGGGLVMKAMWHNSIGDKNIQFVYRYLSNENMKVMSQDVGGTCARKILYNPITGEVKLKRISEFHNTTIEQREKQYIESVSQKPVGGDIELFD